MAWTFERAREYYLGRRSLTRRERTVAHATVVRVVDGNTYAIRYHETDVVLIHRDGTYTINTGGWATRTTKARIEEYSPMRFDEPRRRRALDGRNISVWMIRQTGAPVEYRDGVVVRADGSIRSIPQNERRVYGVRNGPNTDAWQNRMSGTVTGRLSSPSRPPLQNLPLRTESLPVRSSWIRFSPPTPPPPPAPRPGFSATLAKEGRKVHSLLGTLAAAEQRVTRK